MSGRQGPPCKHAPEEPLLRILQLRSRLHLACHMQQRHVCRLRAGEHRWQQNGGVASAAAASASGGESYEGALRLNKQKPLRPSAAATWRSARPACPPAPQQSPSFRKTLHRRLDTRWPPQAGHSRCRSPAPAWRVGGGEVDVVPRVSVVLHRPAANWRCPANTCRKPLLSRPNWQPTMSERLYRPARPHWGSPCMPAVPRTQASARGGVLAARSAAGVCAEQAQLSAAQRAPGMGHVDGVG